MRLRRECRSCRRPFDAYTGGRPRVRCASCRQTEAFDEPVGLPDTPFFAALRRAIRADDA